jgi:hypothetical protein
MNFDELSLLHVEELIVLVGQRRLLANSWHRGK